MEKEYLNRMFRIAREGGKIALRYIDESSPTLKADQSVLTKADLDVSALVKRELYDLINPDPGRQTSTRTLTEHILIEEETADHSQWYDQTKLESVPYVWAVDPIDGTRCYANHMPLFAISIGLFKSLRPWLGVVYFPVLKELMYCDGENSYFVKDAFSSLEQRVKIKPVNHEITPQSMIFGHDAFYKEFQWDSSYCQVILLACAAIDLCWPAIDRGCGAFLRSYIWDFAGSWPIFASAGLTLRALSTGEAMERIHVGLFQGEGTRTWKLKDHFVLSSEKNFPLIKERIIARNC